MFILEMFALGDPLVDLHFNGRGQHLLGSLTQQFGQQVS